MFAGSEFGTNHAFLNKGDGEGQSTKDKLSFQTLAVKHAKHPKKAFSPWKPLGADQLFHYKGVHFKGFSEKKYAMLHKLKEQAKMQKRMTTRQMKHERFVPQDKRKQLWPSSPIAGSGGNAGPQEKKYGRPVFNSDMPVDPMGTNGVFFGSHQGGDSSFTHQPQANGPHGRPQQKQFAPQVASGYMSVRHKTALPHMLYAMQQQQQQQLWPSSPIGQAPVKGRARSWVTAANGDMVPGPAARRHMQGLAFSNGESNMQTQNSYQEQKKDMSWAPKPDKYGRRMPMVMGADGSLMGAAGCVGSTCH